MAIAVTIAASLAAVAIGVAVRDHDVATTTTRSEVSKESDADVQVVEIDAQTEQHPILDSVTVRFPDGEAIDIKLRQSPRMVEPTGERLAGRYPMLWTSAKAGDARAAFELYRSLRYCQQAYDNERDLERAIALMRSGQLQTADMSEPVPILDPDDLAGVERSALVEPFEYCRGTSKEQKREANAWLMLAVRGGEHFALMEYAQTLEASDEAFRLWQASWLDGDVRSLAWLASLATAGWPGTEPDPISGLAYFWLSVNLQSAIWARQGVEIPPARRRLMERMRSDLELRSRKLNPREVQLAFAAAKLTVKSNPNCCYVQ